MSTMGVISFGNAITSSMHASHFSVFVMRGVTVRCFWGDGGTLLEQQGCMQCSDELDSCLLLSFSDL